MKKINFIIPVLILFSCMHGGYNRDDDANYTAARDLYMQSLGAPDRERERLRAEIIRLSPDSEYGLFAKGWFSGRERRFKTALDYYTRAIELNSSEHVFHYNRSLIMMKHYELTSDPASLEEAEMGLNRCLELDPSYANAYFTRAEIKNIRRDYCGAIEDYSLVIRYNNKDSHAYYNRGLLKLTAESDYRGALADAQAAVRLDPGYAAAFCLMGIARYHLGDRKGACKDYRRAEALDPESCIFGGDEGILKDCPR